MCLFSVCVRVWKTERENSDTGSALGCETARGLGRATVFVEVTWIFAWEKAFPRHKLNTWPTHHGWMWMLPLSSSIHLHGFEKLNGSAQETSKRSFRVQVQRLPFVYVWGVRGESKFPYYTTAWLVFEWVSLFVVCLDNADSGSVGECALYKQRPPCPFHLKPFIELDPFYIDKSWRFSRGDSQEVSK